MRQAAYEKYGLISPSIKKVLRHMYKDLVGDSSAAATTSQSELDERVHAFFKLEEPDLVYDLRQLYSGRECTTPGRKQRNFLMKMLEQQWMIDVIHRQFIWLRLFPFVTFESK